MSIIGAFLRTARAHVREERKRQELRLRFAGKRPPRRPPEAGLTVPAVPPRGPLPLEGGAEAPLEFDRD